MLIKPPESSDETDHFSDATEGEAQKPLPDRSDATSPIPMTRVERVDDSAAYGEVPGTDAYKKRTQDAVPDELEIVPDGTRSRSASRLSQEDRPLTPGGTPVPALIVEKVDPDEPSYGDVPGTEAHEKRLADAEPDVVLQAPEVAREPLHGKSSLSLVQCFQRAIDGLRIANILDEQISSPIRLRRTNRGA